MYPWREKKERGLFFHLICKINYFDYLHQLGWPFFLSPPYHRCRFFQEGTWTDFNLGQPAEGSEWWSFCIVVWELQTSVYLISFLIWSWFQLSSLKKKYVCLLNFFGNFFPWPQVTMTSHFFLHALWFLHTVFLELLWGVVNYLLPGPRQAVILSVNPWNLVVPAKRKLT